MKFINTSISLRKLITFSLLLMALFVIDSCRRNDVLTEKQKLTKEEEAITALKERYKNVKGTSVTVELNQKLPSYVLTESGQEIIWNDYVTKIRSNNNIAAKIPDNCLESPEHTYISTTYQLDCTTATYTVIGKYKILVDATVLTENPLNNALKTAGRINYYDLNGSLTSTSGWVYNIAASDIVYVRETVNSNLEPVNEYEVTFRATGLDYNAINSTGYMMLNLRYYTSCGGQASSPGLSPAMYSWGSNTNPCIRNDKVWINPPGGSSWGSIAGTNFIYFCNIPNYVNPDTHVVSIYDITAGTNTLVGTEEILNTGAKSLSYLQVGKTYRFEYKNRWYRRTNDGISPATNYPFNLAGNTSPVPPNITRFGEIRCTNYTPTIEIWQF